MGTCRTLEGRYVIEGIIQAISEGLGKGETSIFPIVIFKVKEGVSYNPEDKNYDLFKKAMKVAYNFTPPIQWSGETFL